MRQRLSSAFTLAVATLFFSTSLVQGSEDSELSDDLPIDRLESQIHRLVGLSINKTHREFLDALVPFFKKEMEDGGYVPRSRLVNYTLAQSAWQRLSSCVLDWALIAGDRDVVSMEEALYKQRVQELLYLARMDGRDVIGDLPQYLDEPDAHVRKKYKGIDAGGEVQGFANQSELTAYIEGLYTHYESALKGAYKARRRAVEQSDREDQAQLLGAISASEKAFFDYVRACGLFVASQDGYMWASESVSAMTNLIVWHLRDLDRFFPL